jgi:hypothetical protein
VWEHDELACVMHGHLSWLVALQKRTSDDTPKKVKRSKGAPPPAPLTALEFVVDTVPDYVTMGTFYMACRQPPAAVLNAVQRRQRYHDYYGDDPEVGGRPAPARAEGSMRHTPARPLLPSSRPPQATDTGTPTPTQ